MNLQQKKDNSFLATEPLGKLLLKLSLPTVTAQIINMLYNIVDRIYIGHIPENGALALTGVGVCMPLIMIVSAFAALFLWEKEIKSLLNALLATVLPHRSSYPFC